MYYLSLHVYSLILLGIVNWLLHFLRFVVKVLDHLYYHYSEFFSSILPIYFSFIWTFVFLVCSFICAVFLCLFIKNKQQKNLLCLKSPLPRLQGWILSSFCFLPSYSCSSGLYNLPIGWDLSWVLFLFFLWWARLSELVILSADDWISNFVGVVFP